MCVSDEIRDCCGKRCVQRVGDFMRQIGLKEETNTVGTALCGVGTGTLCKVDKKYLEVLKCGAGEDVGLMV